MQCIADAAGTEYLDASSSIELSESLEKATANNSGAVAPRAPDPKPSVARPDVVLEMRGPDGELYRGAGILMPIDGGEPIPLESYKRHQVPAGDYNFSGGIVTVSGEIYEPQERMVTIAAETRFVLAAEGPLPPQVTASFQMAGEEIRETVVTVYRDGKKLGSFHGDEVGFVPEGALEFQTDIAASNQTLSVNETFVAGDVKVISFDAKKEVKLIVALILDATGERLRGKPAPELLQNGEVVTKINASSGGFVTPGQYVFRADDGLNLYSQDLSVSDEDTQEIEIKVPSGAIVVIYQDVSGAQEEPKRIFLRRADDNRGVTRSSNEPVGLLPGRYVLTGHPKAAGYPETAFEITAGETKEIVLQATN